MATTIILKTPVEAHVRNWCSRKYGKKLKNRETEIRLITGGGHRFDVVSEDGSVIGGIKSSSLRPDGKVGTGVINSTFTELYFLSLTKAITKLMILTDKGYCEYFRRKSEGKVASGIDIVYCPLTNDLSKDVCIVHNNCRNEIGKK